MSIQPYSTALEIFEAALVRAPDGIAVCYFDAVLTYRQLDAMSDGLAEVLRAGGVGRADRVGLFLQNTPHFVIAALAIWKLGAAGVPINPMNREREVSLIFADCAPKALICLDELFRNVIVRVEQALLPELILRVSPGEFQTRFDGRVLPPSATELHAEVTRFATLNSAAAPCAAELHRDDLALLVYTSGTTGLPKGAMITHGAFSFNANTFSEVAGLREADAVLCIAPLFHITGSVCCLGTAMMRAAPLIVTYRFEPGTVLDAIAEWQPKFVVAAITAFIAIFNHRDVTAAHLASFQRIYSGGAAVPGSFVASFEAKFGHYIHNCYGLTETAAPTHMVPFGTRAALSEDGVLSIGRPTPGVRARVIGDDGNPVAAGTPGELVLEGPMVSRGYWMNAAETAANMRADGFRTGDIATVDAEGWYYIVDRKKDMIVSSGYKVWPREVEDVLYTHPSIREAAVVGVADAYRGETVKAFVSPRPGITIHPTELIEYCRLRMAAYKCPRSIEILDDLPKTASGKILRRSLR
jgi:long-chain acyl-CoA synthetase